MLRKGFVFAYEADSMEPFGDWCPLVVDPDANEAITFVGCDAYDPGDVEGVAVYPVRIVHRESTKEWFRRQTRSKDPDRRAAARAALRQL